MIHRNRTHSLAWLGVFVSSGLALGAATPLHSPMLSLDRPVLTAQANGTPDTPLMVGLDKIGLAKPVQSAGLNIYGWIEAGYDANLRNNAGSRPGAGLITHPLGFTEEIGNHVTLNQVALRIEKLVDAKKWDLGGLVEANFGTDDNFTSPAYSNAGDFSAGWEFQTPGDNPGEVPHFDFTQAYLDLNIPVGNGIKIRAGRFYTLIGHETFDPRGNPFYSHSYIYNDGPITNTGILGYYTLNDQWSFVAGVSRGFNQTTEDDNGSPDLTGQIAYTPSKQLQFLLNYEIGPQNANDTSHDEVMLNPIVSYQLTDKLQLTAEGLYEYDGGFNGFAPHTHAYGDNYGIAAYAGYSICSFATLNARLEWFHTYGGNPYPLASSSGGNPGLASSNAYELTLGVAIKPLAKDPIGKNLILRPEVRYDFAEDHDYPVGNGSSIYRDQWTVGADLIFTF